MEKDTHGETVGNSFGFDAMARDGQSRAREEGAVKIKRSRGFGSSPTSSGARRGLRRSPMVANAKPKSFSVFGGGVLAGLSLPIM